MTLDPSMWRPLPQVGANLAGWERLRTRLDSKVFLHSEGSDVSLGMPVVATKALTEQASRLVERFDRFSSALARAYFEHPDLADEFLANPLLAPAMDIDRNVAVAAPASRFDCVLDGAGQLHVIEHNSNAICVYHQRNLFYLIRGLSRNGFEEDARRLDELTRSMCAGYRRHYDANCRDPKPIPTIGVLHPSGWHRATNLVFQAAFERYGWRYTHGGPEHLRIDSHGVYLCGEKVDLLWSDFLFYMAYQSARMQETKWPTKLGEYGDTPEIVHRLMSDDQFLTHLRDRTLVMMSPGTSYLALAKPLMSWVHREDVPFADPDREWLEQHTARTYSHRERIGGAVTAEQIIDDKDRFVIKPALYGGSHGVQLGCEVDRDAWAAAISKLWEDPSWAVQKLVVPTRTLEGDWLSVGVVNYGGTFGGFILRTSPKLTVSARLSKYIPVAFPTPSDP